jgi:uridine phosphorylase
MELLIAAGARNFIVLGAAGSLQENVPAGSLVVPDGAVREDGTSFHYLPPEVLPRPSAALAERLRDGCRQHGVEPFSGMNWSTDAIFRELKKKVLYHRSQGVVTVEMEAAALFSVGMFRGVDIAFLLAVSDELFRPWAPAFREPVYRERLLMAHDIALEVAGGLPVRT